MADVKVEAGQIIEICSARHEFGGLMRSRM